MTTPIIILSGGAGSGKDTVAEMLCKGRNGVMLAQADPMKQFAQAAFGFTTDQLWGPSSARNAEDARFLPGPYGHETWMQVQNTIIDQGVGARWLKRLGIPGFQVELRTWFDSLKKDCKDRILTPRLCLQSLGTEFGRTVSADLWSTIAINTARSLLIGGNRYAREMGLVSDSTQYGYDFVVITDGRFRNEILNVTSIGGRTMKIINPVDESRDTEAAGIRGHTSESELKRIPDSWFDVILTNDKTQGLDYLNDRVYQIAMAWAEGCSLYKEQQ